MSGRYPVQTYLHRVKLAASPDCPFCPWNKETLNHFACLCPQFREASTAANNQVQQKLYTSLSKLLPKSWVVHEEIQMHQTGLRLDLVPADCMITAGRSFPDNHRDMINVGSLQPDMVLVSNTLKKIGLLEICRPIDESSSQLQAATVWKLQTNAPLLTALTQYLDDGWQVQILPWVVGVHGLFITSSATPVFKFLSIPSDCSTELLEETTLESVKALYFLHRTRRLALLPHIGPTTE
jgi:hypothetical protein